MKKEDSPIVELPEEFNGLETFIVGGFVRDWERGVESDDVDLMVVKETPKEMIKRGFKLHIGGSTPEGMTSEEVQQKAKKAAIDNNLPEVLDEMIDGTVFPVFIDSKGREVSLPRTEEKIKKEKRNDENANEHKQFRISIVDSNKSVRESIKIDMARRDLTINSMAMNARTGEIIDPFGGIEDLKNGVLKHTTEAFAEDPLRVLRVARFLARISGSEIHPETKELMASLSNENDLGSIPVERVSQEMMKMFKQSDNPRAFFDSLREVGALEVVFPEIADLIGVPAGPERKHKEGDAFEHTMCVLEEMASLRPNDTDALLAALAHDLGKGRTPKDELPNHYKHSKFGVKVAEEMTDRLNMSTHNFRVMRTSSRQHMRFMNIESMNETSVLDMFKESHLNIEQLVALGLADAHGRIPQRNFPENIARERLERAKFVVEEITGKDSLRKRGLSVDEIGDEIPGERVSNFVRQDRVEKMRKMK